MSLDIGKLENVHQRGSGLVARCPACAADGHDTAGDHLFIRPDGAFGCVIHPGPAGRDHRSSVMRLAGDRTVRTLECAGPARQAPPTVLAKDILRTLRTPFSNPRAQAAENPSPCVKDSDTSVRSVRTEDPTVSAHRWGCAPVALPLAPDLPPLARPDASLLLSYLHRQGESVITWTSSQSIRYGTFNPGWSTQQCQLAASLDCALWQHEPRSEATDRPAVLRDLVDLLRFLEQAAAFHSTRRAVQSDPVGESLPPGRSL